MQIFRGSLNTYVTNTVEGRVFIVDGQQRLTTLTLILIKLLNKAKQYNSKTIGWLETKIAGYSGTEHKYWMNHQRHLSVFEALINGDNAETISTESGITAVNMVRNYHIYLFSAVR